MTLAPFGQEHAHGLGIHGGQHQSVQRAVVRAEGGKGILLLTDNLRVYFRPPPAGAQQRRASLIRPKRASS
jgi:hypothetical protein